MIILSKQNKTYKNIKGDGMFENTRQMKIVELLKEKNSLSVIELAEIFSVSNMTIRRDLEKLQDLKLIQRTHGGAFINKTLTRELSYHEKTLANSATKTCIAQVVLKYINEKSIIYLDAGTTTYEIARGIKHNDLTIITNDIRIASLLMHTENKVIFLGGLIDKESGSTTDLFAANLAKEFSIDLAIMGTSSIDEELYLCTPDPQRQNLKKTIIKHARKSILVTDEQKFYSNSVYKIVHMNEFDIVVTDYVRQKLPSNIEITCEYIQVNCSI